jgi:hypothetical protein
MWPVIAGMTAAWIASGSLALASQDVSANLKQRMQALMDAVTYGKPAVWDDALDAKVVITDENGEVADKAASVKQVVPLPKGISGTIIITDWHATVENDVAFSTFVDDEHENFHGQHLHALYRATATWIKRAAGWKLLAMQVMALQQDPPAITLPAKMTDDYVGRYSAGPDYVYTIAKAGGKLMGAANTAKPTELKAELADVLFRPGQPRTRDIFQRDAAGHVIGFLSRREERDVVFTRLK